MPRQPCGARLTAMTCICPDTRRWRSSPRLRRRRLRRPHRRRGLPAANAEPAATSTLAEYLAPARDSQNEFSGGDHSFFDTAPINDEYEPENPRGRLYTRLAVSGAVVAVVAVVVVAWANSHGASGEEPAPVEVKSQPAMTAPAPVRTAVAAPPPARPAASISSPAPPAARPAEVPPTSTIPSSMPERIAVTTAPPRPANGDPGAGAAGPRAGTPTGAPGRRGREIDRSGGVRRVRAQTGPSSRAARGRRRAAASKPASVTAAVAAAPKASAPVAAAPAPVRELRTPPPPPPQKKPTAAAAAAPRPAATSPRDAAASAPTPTPPPPTATRRRPSPRRRVPKSAPVAPGREVDPRSRLPRPAPRAASKSTIPTGRCRCRSSDRLTAPLSRFAHQVP